MNTERVHHAVEPAELPGMTYRRPGDTSRSLLYVSETCPALTGYPVEALTAGCQVLFRDLVHGEDLAAVQEQVESALRDRRAFQCLYRLIRADGQERWVLDSGQGVFADDGALFAVEGVIVDAGDHAQAFRRLQQQVADRTRKLSAFHAILDALSTPAELPVTLSKSLSAGLDAVQGDVGFIHLREKSGRTLRLVSRNGISDRMAEAITVVSNEEGFVAGPMQQREPVVVLSRDDEAAFAQLSADAGLSIYVGVPILRGQRVWGTLSVMGSDPDRLGDEEVALLVSVGEEIGIVVENVRLRRQAERLLLIQERNRLARELHDSVTQSLYSVTLFAEVGRRTALAQGNDETAEYFTQIGDTGQQALKEMRLLVHKLRPSILAKEGLVRALQQRLNSVEGRAGVNHSFVVHGDTKLSPPLEDALFQIAQEALNNALKHSLASAVNVNLTFMEGKLIALRVEDNGRGFDVPAAAGSDGMGLTTMRERAEMFGGSLTIQSHAGAGTVVEARLKRTAIASRHWAEFDVEDLP